MKFYKFLIAFLLINNSLKCQVLNAYAKVTSVTGGSVLALSNVDQSGHTFTVGGQVVVMQMQDDVIGTNTTNASTFGDLSSIANAGRYEIRTISARTPTSGTPTSITLAVVLANTFNTGANSSVQLISFRDLGSNYTTTANIDAPGWDGNVGGVIAISVTNTLTLNHRVQVDGDGFADGNESDDNNGSVCVAANSTNYRANNADLGYKGEGIYKVTNNTFNNARGKIINGGGGGGDHNAGGAGGGNYTSGGNGGAGYNNCTTNPGGGLGGVSLSAHISVNRVFMGGGGGGGQQNNGNGSPGGDGGGIILIKANTLATSTSCGSSIRVSANGDAANNTDGNDGAGGGGAGGSIIFQVNTFSINASCPLTNRASGGNGGNCTDGTPHAGGGGGGQGVVIYSSAQPTLNVTTQVNNGAAGVDNTGGSITAGAGSGTSGSGTIVAASGPLPIQLISFGGNAHDNHVRLNWQTASEKNNKHFIIESSDNAVDFKQIGTLTGFNNSDILRHYELIDRTPNYGLNYYRLKQVDNDGTEFVAPIVVVEFGILDNFKVYPNPLNENESLIVELGNIAQQIVEISILDLTGKTFFIQQFETELGQPIILNNLNLEKGIYQLNIGLAGSGFKTQKIIIR